MRTIRIKYALELSIIREETKELHYSELQELFSTCKLPKWLILKNIRKFFKQTFKLKMKYLKTYERFGTLSGFSINKNYVQSKLKK